MEIGPVSNPSVERHVYRSALSIDVENVGKFVGFLDVRHRAYDVLQGWKPGPH